MSKKPSVVQLNNNFIKDENLKKRYEAEEIRQKNRFMAWVLVFVMLLFILPTYNLVRSYLTLQSRKAEVVQLRKDYAKLKKRTDNQQTLAKQLKDDTFVAKYARAKYYFSKDGEKVYPLPDLLPK